MARGTRKKEHELALTSIVSLGFAVAIFLLKPPYKIQKVMRQFLVAYLGIC